MVEEYTDPEVIDEKFGNAVDLVVDGGIGGMIPSTVVIVQLMNAGDTAGTGEIVFE